MIKSITCPCCGGQLYRIRDPSTSKAYSTSSGNEFLWKCGSCVHFYPDEWFDVYKQFEHLVVRI